jgi:hypothetical protein
LSTGVHGGITLHELPPGEWLGSAGLEGELSEVVGGEPKTLMCWVWPQHGHDRLVQEASDERHAPCCPRQDVRAGWPDEGTRGDGLCQLGADEAEGAEVHGGPRG